MNELHTERTKYGDSQAIGQKGAQEKSGIIFLSLSEEKEGFVLLVTSWVPIMYYGW